MFSGTYLGKQCANNAIGCPVSKLSDSGGMQRGAGVLFMHGGHTGYEVGLSDHWHSVIHTGTTQRCSLRASKWAASFSEDGVESIQATRKLNKLLKVIPQLRGKTQNCIPWPGPATVYRRFCPAAVRHFWSLTKLIKSTGWNTTFCCFVVKMKNILYFNLINYFY